MWVILSLVQMTVIYYLSAIPGNNLTPLPYGTDKVIHFTLYFFLGIFFQRSLKKFHWIIPMLLGSFYGITDEFHQSFVYGRAPSVGDWVADTLGVIAGVVIIIYFSERRDAKK